MPYKMKEVDGYQVKGPSGVHAKHTTKEKAEAQMRLLRGIEHGMVPRGNPTKSGNALRDAVMGSSSAVTRVARAKKKRRT